MQKVFWFTVALMLGGSLYLLAVDVPLWFRLSYLGAVFVVSIFLVFVMEPGDGKTPVQRKVEAMNEDPEQIAKHKKVQEEIRAGEEFARRHMQREYWDEVGDKEYPTDEELILAIAQGKLTGVRFLMPMDASEDFTYSAKWFVEKMERDARRLVVDERF